MENLFLTTQTKLGTVKEFTMKNSNKKYYLNLLKTLSLIILIYGLILKLSIKNFNISLTSYYDGRYLNLHKDKTSELTTVIVLSDDFEGGQFVLTDDENPPYNFETLDGLIISDLKLGDSISFNGSKTFHGVLPLTKGTRYALNIWMTETDFDYPKLKNNKTLL
mgnify:CR=1 FL=1